MLGPCKQAGHLYFELCFSTLQALQVRAVALELREVLLISPD